MISPLVIYCLKWYSFTFKYLVLGLYLWTFTISRVTELSSNTLYFMVGALVLILVPFSFISFKIFMIGIASESAHDNPVYSDSVLDKAISISNWYFHIIGAPM